MIKLSLIKAHNKTKNKQAYHFHGYWLAEHIATNLNQDKSVLFYLNTHKAAANANEWRMTA